MVVFSALTLIQPGCDHQRRPAAPISRILAAASNDRLYVLIYQNRVSIGINDHKAGRPRRAFVRF
jgi:hypothetical protein